MKDLTGSEKQTEWAEKIRARVQPIVAEIVATTLASASGDAHEGLRDRYAAIAAAAMDRTDASYWIEKWADKGDGWAMTLNARWVQMARTNK